MADRYEDLVERVSTMGREMDRLRRQQAVWQRRHRAAELLLLGAGFLALCAGRARTAQQPDRAREFVASRLTIVDAGNKPRLVIGADNDGGRVDVLDPNGDSVVLVGADKDGGYLSVRDAADKGAVVLAQGQNGGLVCVYSKDDKPVLVLYPDRSRRGTIEVADRAARARVRIGVDGAAGRLWLLDNAGRVRAELPPQARRSAPARPRGSSGGSKGR